MQLCNKIESEGTSICYNDVALKEFEGQFDAEENTIYLFGHDTLHHFKKYFPDLQKQLCVLAHEYGHCLSHKKENYSKEFKYALNKIGSPMLLEKEKSMILKEENKAWDNALKILIDLDCLVPEFFKIKEYSLKSYYHGFSK